MQTCVDVRKKTAIIELVTRLREARSGRCSPEGLQRALKLKTASGVLSFPNKQVKVNVSSFLSQPN